jgi:hypothetical protein
MLDDMRKERALALTIMLTEKSIGYWRSDSETELPDPTLLGQDELSDHDRLRLATFLDAGRLKDQWKGFSWCRFRTKGCKVGGFDMGTCCLTDGKYVWPEGLSHYVREHHIWLPEQFVEHALWGIRGRT